MADPRFFEKQPSFSLSVLAECSGAKILDDDAGDRAFSDVAPLDQAGASDISFLDNIKYVEEFKKTQAGACVVHPKMVEHAPEGCVLLESQTPYKAYALIAQTFYPEDYPAAKISDHAHIDPSARIAQGCVIEAGAVIGPHAEIGAGTWIESGAVIGQGVCLGQKCRIGPQATLSHAIVGNAVRLYPGVRVGQDGFGFAIDPAGHVKVPQLGRVMIEDHVEIGANTCIDRGAGPDTVIGAGTWIDNLVQIGHNVKIGRGCVIVAQVGISGSTVLEDFVVMGGQSGVAGHLRIGMGARIGAQSGVMRNVPAGEEQLGSPALPLRERMKHLAILKKMAQSKTK